MKLTISVAESSPSISEIIIEERAAERLSADLEACPEGRRAYWIWDERVWGFWGERAGAFGWPGPESGRVILFPASEPKKRLAAIEDLARQLVRLGADRQSSLVAVGGGVTGDVVGMLASVYMRGIPFFQVPTTLLAQVDSSVGGKTGVDLPEGKNLLGTFHQPRIVWIDPGLLETLPPPQFRQGMAEVVKTAILGDGDLWSYLEEHVDALKRREGPALTRVISACCKVKAAVVESDEKEAGRRRILNLGHTVGHALERLSEYGLYHGDAVAMGMMAAMWMAVRSGMMSGDGLERLERLCSAWDLPVRIPAEYDPEAIIGALGSDKKRLGSNLHFILPVRFGEVADVVNPDMGLLKDALTELRGA